MVGIDTNVLVRYITQDGNEVKAANRFFKKCTAEEQGFISLIVLCEMVWVLSRAYKYSRNDICSIIEKVLTSQELAIENSVVAWHALRSYSQQKADFSDFVIGDIHKENGAEKTVTFDRKAAESSLFTLLK
ncbi:MAG: PIN domain-containing protein [Planctomycetota bacterium]|jgi:predicted nucleic-acid-binding protein